MSDYVAELSDNDDDADDDNIVEGYTGGIAYFYDQSTPPTFIESIFGEPYHISDKYASHQITWRLVLTLMSESIATGSILWLEIAYRYYFISLWSIGPSQFTQILCIIQIPFTIRILYGLLIDSVPFCGYRRKSYLFLFGIAAIISSFGLIYYNNSFIMQIFCLCIRSFAIAFCDVIIGAITVERCEYKSHRVAIRLQSLNYFSMYVVSCIGLIFAAKLEESQQPNQLVNVYWMHFGITFLIIIGSLLLTEQKQKQKHKKNTNFVCVENEKENQIKDKVKLKYGMLSNIDIDEDEDQQQPMNTEYNNNNNIKPQKQSYSVNQILSLTFETFCRKIVFYPLLFTFLIAAQPRTDQTIDYYLMYSLKFDSNKIGYLQIVSSAAFLLSVVIITIHSKSNKFSLRSLFFIWTFIAAIIPYCSLILIFGINKTIFHISDFVFAAINTILIRITVDMLLLATAVLYARICPPGIEAVFFTLLTSVATFGEVTSYFLTSCLINLFDIQCAKIQYNKFYGLTMHDPNIHSANDLQCDFHNLWIFIIAVNLTSLIPLMWIFWIPNESEMKCIAITLSEAATTKLKHNKKRRVDTKDMILFYFLCVDYLFPFFNCICCCCCRRKIKYANNNNNQYIL